jgi:hypothetical protein
MQKTEQCTEQNMVVSSAAALVQASALLHDIFSVCDHNGDQHTLHCLVIRSISFQGGLPPPCTPHRRGAYRPPTTPPR